MLAENISLCKVKSLKSSRVFSDFLIQFNNEIDIEKTKQRLVKRYSCIELSLPEKTNCILLLTQSVEMLTTCIGSFKSIHKYLIYYIVFYFSIYYLYFLLKTSIFLFTSV